MPPKPAVRSFSFVHWKLTVRPIQPRQAFTPVLLGSAIFLS